jgi:hypothetical protein
MSTIIITINTKATTIPLMAAMLNGGAGAPGEEDGENVDTALLLVVVDTVLVGNDVPSLLLGVVSDVSAVVPMVLDAGVSPIGVPDGGIGVVLGAEVDSVVSIEDVDEGLTVGVKVSITNSTEI